MDPITGAIVAALAAGVISGATKVGEKVIVGAYDALKAAIKQKCGAEGDLVKAVETLEQKPDSGARQAVVAEEVTVANLAADAELVKLAQALLDALKDTPEGQQAISKYNINVQGGQVGVIGDDAHIEDGIHFGQTTHVTQTAGDNATQIGTARDVTIKK